MQRIEIIEMKKHLKYYVLKKQKKSPLSCESQRYGYRKDNIKCSEEMKEVPHG